MSEFKYYPNAVYLEDYRQYGTQSKVNELTDWLTEKTEGKWSILISTSGNYVDQQMQIDQVTELKSSGITLVFFFEKMNDALMFKLAFV